MTHNPLGRDIPRPERYDPGLLFPIARADGRGKLGPAVQHFTGLDVWHLFEVSWLAAGGRPEVRCGRLTYPADSPRIVESKSLKLYLNSLAMTRFDSEAVLVETVKGDLAPVLQTSGVRLDLLDVTDPTIAVVPPGGCCVDAEGAVAFVYRYDAGLLATVDMPAVDDALVSHLLKTNCPVTGQPDWGTVQVVYSASRRLDPAAFLRYVVSFRTHQDYHETCCETIFCDLFERLEPEALTVHCGFTRRGGIAISPVRTFGRPLDEAAAFSRWPRQ